MFGENKPSVYQLLHVSMNKNINNKPEVNLVTTWSPDRLIDSCLQFEALSNA